MNTKPFILEYRDARERWHRRRGSFKTVAAAESEALALPDLTGWRIVEIQYRSRRIVSASRAQFEEATA